MKDPTTTTMNEIGVWVKASDELPEHGTTVIAKHILTHEVSLANKAFFHTRNDAEKYYKWLKPLPSHVPISVERLEALEKCAELLEKYVKIDAGYNIPHHPYDAAKQALTNLNKQ